jgi:hypothetical protein
MRRRSVVEYKIKELERMSSLAKSHGQNNAREIYEQQALVLKNSLGKTSRQLKHDWLLTSDEISSCERNPHYQGGYIFKAQRVNQIRKWMLGGREE